MGHDGEPAGWQDPAADVPVIVNGRRDRNADLDKKLAFHVNHVVPEERRAGRRDAAGAERFGAIGSWSSVTQSSRTSLNLSVSSRAYPSDWHPLASTHRASAWVLASTLSMQP
jgi:hypothetical protein